MAALDAVRGRHGVTADGAIADGVQPDAQIGVSPAAEPEQEEELARLRDMVAKFKEILGPLGGTA